MTDRYSSVGKQVLHDGQHFADARDPDAADLIVEALNDRSTEHQPELSYVWQHHRVARQNDEYACSCGARWDATEGEEHP